MKAGVYGGARLRRKLKRMPDEATRHVKQALESSAALLYAETLARVPRDEGDLAAALHRQRSGDGLGQKVGWWKKGNIRNWKLAGWRAHFTEFGTRRSRARPSLGPAYRANRDWILRRVKTAVNVALKKVARS